MRRVETKAMAAARAAADEALDRRHPRRSRPPWFAAKVAQNARPLGANRIEVRYSAEVGVPLKPNQAWEDRPTGRRLVETDEATGQKFVVITRDTNQFIDLFTVIFDVRTGAVEVTQDMNFADVDPGTLA